MAHWLIAGASRGIGFEMARQLAARGERVTASVRDPASNARRVTRTVRVGLKAGR